DEAAMAFDIRIAADCLKCKLGEPFVRKIELRHARHLTEIISELDRVHIMVEYRSAHHHIRHIQLVRHGTCDSRIDDNAHIILLEQQCSDHTRVHFAYAAFDKSHFAACKPSPVYLRMGNAVRGADIHPLLQNINFRFHRTDDPYDSVISQWKQS